MLLCQDGTRVAESCHRWQATQALRQHSKPKSWWSLLHTSPLGCCFHEYRAWIKGRVRDFWMMSHLLICERKHGELALARELKTSDGGSKWHSLFYYRYYHTHGVKANEQLVPQIYALEAVKLVIMDLSEFAKSKFFYSWETREELLQNISSSVLFLVCSGAR